MNARELTRTDIKDIVSQSILKLISHGLNNL